MAQDKISMPSGIGGLVNYQSEYKSGITFQPSHVIMLTIITIIVMITLHIL